MEKPKLLENPDLSNLKAICQAHLDNLEEDSDDNHYIYEATMTALYDEDIFNYINDQL